MACQVQLMHMTQQVVEKDALIQEKEKLYVQLKNIIARLVSTLIWLPEHMGLDSFEVSDALFLAAELPFYQFCISFRQPGPEVAEQLAWCAPCIALHGNLSALPSQRTTTCYASFPKQVKGLQSNRHLLPRGGRRTIQAGKWIEPVTDAIAHTDADDKTIDGNSNNK